MSKITIALLLGLVLVSASPSAEAEDCSAQLKELKAWLVPALAQVRRGAFATQAGVAARLAPAQHSGGKAPPYPAATVEVLAEDFVVDGKPVGVTGLGARLDAHPNIVFGRNNPRAVARGIVLAVHRDAPASRVRSAISACKMIGERRVWLAFGLGKEALQPPRRSAVTGQLESAGTDGMAVAGAVRDAFAGCPSVTRTLRKLGGLLPVERLPTLIRELPADLRRCHCATAPADAASILWVLGLRDLVTAVSLPVDRLLALVGQGSTPWEELAPRVSRASRP